MGSRSILRNSVFILKWKWYSLPLSKIKKWNFIHFVCVHVCVCLCVQVCAGILAHVSVLKVRGWSFDVFNSHCVQLSHSTILLRLLLNLELTLSAILTGSLWDLPVCPTFQPPTSGPSTEVKGILSTPAFCADVRGLTWTSLHACSAGTVPVQPSL